MVVIFKVAGRGESHGQKGVEDYLKQKDNYHFTYEMKLNKIFMHLKAKKKKTLSTNN